MRILKFFLTISLIVLLSGIADGALTASGHPDWSPVMRQEDGKIVGIGPDLLSRFSESFGLNINCSYAGSWSEVQELGRAGRIDLIVAAYKTKEREEYFIYSEPYFDDPIGLFAIDKFDYQAKEDLLGHSVAVTKGDSYGEEMDQFLSESKDSLNLKEYDTAEDAFKALQNGESECFLYTSYAGKKLIRDNDQFKNVKEAAIVGSQPMYMMISKQSKYAEILPLLNHYIGFVKESGELDQIISSAKEHAGF